MSGEGQTVAGNVTGASPTGPGYLAWLASVGFNNTQFTTFGLNIVDDATSISGHPDLPNSRILFQNNPTNQTGVQGGHGFLNTNIIAGFNNGTGFPLTDSSGFHYGLGIAPFAQVGSTAMFGPNVASPIAWENSAYIATARFSSNSWGLVNGSSPVAQYTVESQLYDQLVRDASWQNDGNQDYTIVFAAGNSGPGENTVSAPGTAKNVITVGAGENNDQAGTDGCGEIDADANNITDIIDFSSRGPVNPNGGDGRWKPDIVAPGTHIEAGVPQTNYDGTSICNKYFPPGQTLYGWSSGTSHSTPCVAGGGALVRQWFLNHSLTPPSGAMVKAVLMNSAEYMTGAFSGDTLPSNNQGMGRMDLGRTFDDSQRVLVDQTILLAATGDTFSISGTVANAGRPFRVTLAWSDTPGAITGAPWVNNLDLSVTAGGSTYKGNVFSGAFSITGGFTDTENNVESVFLPAGTTGPFSLTIRAANIAGDGVPGNTDFTDQDFALVVYNGLTAPAANFTGTPTSGPNPLDVNFTDTSTGTVTGRAWTFGDGGTSTDQNPSHTYIVPAPTR